MYELKNNIDELNVPEGSIGLFFLGQAGFVFKDNNGQTIALDPYLSDCCNRYFGYKRLLPYLISADNADFDIILTSHAHYDHFDVDSIPEMMKSGNTELITAMDGKPECERLHLDNNITYFSCGDVLKRGKTIIEGVKCDHGKLAPDALGILMEIDKKTVYYMGDTCFREDYLQYSRLHGTDLLILPINGAFGNLNEQEAARVCSILKPKLAIPCHYWNFAEHGGNPDKFMHEMKKTAPDIKYLLMRPGEEIII